MVAESDGRACPDVTDFEVEGILRKQQDVGRFNISMSDLWSLKMCKDFDHAGDEHEYVLLVEGFFSGAKVGFKVGNAFLHLNIPLLAEVHAPSLFLDTIAAFVLHDVRMRIVLNLGQ